MSTLARGTGSGERDRGAQPYRVLAGLIENELELVGHGRYGELEESVRRRAELVAQLPAPSTDEDRRELERARLLHERLVIDTLRAEAELERALTRLRQVREAARGYRAPDIHRYSTSA